MSFVHRPASYYTAIIGGLPTKSERAKVNECPNRVCRSGCQMSQCKIGKGKRWGSETVGEVSIYDCLECLGLRPTLIPGSNETPKSMMPKTMVPPSQRRPVWRGGIIQLMVTRACDLSCHHCTQGSNLTGKPVVMTPDEFEQAVVSLRGYWGVFGVFGGNPTLSPHFEEYCKILRAHVPFEQRGLWCNHPRGMGKVARVTFNPKHSNLNCHLSSEAHAEFSRDWPESIPFLKGLDTDSVHGAPFVAMKDVIPDEAERWALIGKCDVNQFWSAAIGVVPGRGLRAFFCELAYAQAALHATNPDWDGTGQPMPDTGLEVVPGWWRKPMADFESQARLHCHACGIPMRRPGQSAVGGDHEEFSETHRWIARPKTKGREVQFVAISDMIERSGRPATQYLPGVTPGYNA